jgi:predicted glutamine amidotransferase
LLGYVADRPTSVAEILGEEALADFTALTALHADGWGMAWHEPGDHQTGSASSPESALEDPTYDELVRRPLGRAGLVHLRWASAGLAVTPENTHPFVDDGYAFAHNGHITPIDRLEGLLTKKSRARLRGTTDSERYFRFVLQRIAETGDEHDGVSQALGTLMGEFPESSLNALMLTPEHMFAIHINSRASTPPALHEIFDSEEEMPTRHATEYFAMDYRLAPHAVHVISSGLDEEGWSLVPDDMAVMVDLHTREMTQLDLRHGSASPGNHTSPDDSKE